MIDFFYCDALVEHGRQFLRFHTKDGIVDQDVPFSPYCYVPTKGESKYHDAMTHEPLKISAFKTQSNVNNYTHAGYDTWEADVPFVRRCMIDLDWKIGTVPRAYVDIEVDDSNGVPRAERDRIICIGIVFDDGREVYLDDADEANIMREFMDLMKNVGMIITYNGGVDIWQTRAFDIPYMSKRFDYLVKTDINFRIAMGVSSNGRFMFDKLLHHCAFVDIYLTYKHEMGRVGLSLAGGYSLENVCQYELGKGKLKHDGKFSDMTDEELREYNMRDVWLLKELDEKKQFTEMSIGLARLTNLCLVSWRKNHKWDELQPLIMVDNLLLKEGKRLGLVFPNRRYGGGPPITGAKVFEPKQGLHTSVQNYDVRQMYPSIMINEKVSPDKHRVIIPNILKRLTKMRAKLKEKYQISKSSEDYIIQYNYKVLANVFYGAIANQSCRIYNRENAQFVTNHGKRILQKISDTALELGYDTIYGDTDSIFLKVDKDKVDTLTKIFNTKIAPYEVNAGEHYSSILFVGDEHGGIKKRYAGISDGKLKISGLEAIKRDSTILAREMQMIVLEKLLRGVSVDSCRVCVNRMGSALHKGVYDKYLIISKGVKEISEYKDKIRKDGTMGLKPPHVRALKMALDKGHQNMYDIQYVKTTDDVYPILEGETFPTNIDYEWYFEKQIIAVTESLFISIEIQNGSYMKKRKRTQNHVLTAFMSS